MAYTRQIINVGTTADDGSGDYLRDALIKANTNFQNQWQVGAVDTSLDLTSTLTISFWTRPDNVRNCAFLSNLSVLLFDEQNNFALKG